MRVVQNRLVEATNKPTTTLLAILPSKNQMAKTSTPARGGQNFEPQPPAPVPTAAPVLEPTTQVTPAAGKTVQSSHPEPISYYEQEQEYDDRDVAMAAAFHRGGYSLREISNHFGAPLSTVRRAADQHRARLEKKE